MPFVDLVALLALLQFLAFGVWVGRARGRYGVKAPATTGAEGFDRVYRVQMNTLELLVVLLPSLYLAARYGSPLWAAALGALYLVGRVVYALAYVRDPASRSVGFLLSVAPIFALIAIAGWGALRSVAG